MPLSPLEGERQLLRMLQTGIEILLKGGAVTMRNIWTRPLIIAKIIPFLIFWHVLSLIHAVKLFVIHFRVSIVHEPAEARWFVLDRNHKVESLLKSFRAHMDELQHSIYTATKTNILALNSDARSMSPIKSQIFRHTFYKSSTLWQWQHLLGIESIHWASFCAI